MADKIKKKKRKEKKPIKKPLGSIEKKFVKIASILSYCPKNSINTPYCHYNNKGNHLEKN